MPQHISKSRLIAGTMSWGPWGQNWSTLQTIQAIADCMEVGINRFDHAAIYGGYTTEAQFGKAFVEGGFHRETVEIISKCGIQYPSDKNEYTIKHYDYSPTEIRRSVEQSLRNLQTDYLDALLLHRPSPLLDAKQVAEILNILMAEGKIRTVGVSNFTPSQMALLHQELPFTFHQLEVSLTHDAPMLNGDLDTAQRLHIQTMAWKPLGSYFGESNEQQARLRAVVPPMAEKYDLTEDALLLAWLLRHPAHIQPVLGTTQKARWQAATKAVSAELALEDWFTLWTASMGHAVP